MAAAIYNANRTKDTDRVWQPIDFVRTHKHKEQSPDQMVKVMDRLMKSVNEELGVA